MEATSRVLTNELFEPQSCITIICAFLSLFFIYLSLSLPPSPSPSISHSIARHYDYDYCCYILLTLSLFKCDVTDTNYAICSEG